MVCTTTKNIFIQQTQGSTEYSPIPQANCYNYKQQATYTPVKTVPIKVNIHYAHIKAKCCTPKCQMLKPTKLGTFQDHILQLDPWEHELLTNVVLLHDPFTITPFFYSQTSALQAAMDNSIANEHRDIRMDNLHH